MADGGPAPARVHLRPGRESVARSGHPWLFSGAIAREELPDGAPPPLAEVVAADGAVLAWGLYSAASRIRVRILGSGRAQRADRAFFHERLRRALALRRDVVAADTTGYRLVNSEGDALPGWTVDRFASVAVSQITSAGLDALADEAYAALADLLPDVAIYHAGDLAARRQEGLALASREIVGPVPTEVEFLESGLRWTAEIAAGQKTGFYSDQRENRRLARRLAPGRSTLDLFAHGGGFGISALAGGARSAVFVESAARLVERGRRHVAANALDGDRAVWEVADVFDWLRVANERFDLVVVDPPPFAKRRADVERAARAYKDVNRLALARVAPGGHLLTFSCSGAIDGKLFRQVLHAAALEAGVAVALLAPLAAAPDHPFALAHPEGEYLKGWWARVEPRR